MKEEDIIRKKCGSKNPFLVPEGYFENFTSKVMDALPELKTSPKTVNKEMGHARWKRIAIFAAAAAICGAMFMGILPQLSTMQAPTTSTIQVSQTTELNAIDETYIEDALDYAMVSNHEIVQYLSEAY
ncbi:MAG: hypothetical protein IKA86_01830 [Paraprevotella sp.]|nr:hypothetical protein [Paraprevotella sp.]MBR2379724.1 hypothetical protein [Paraprevotella sp.]